MDKQQQQKKTRPIISGMDCKQLRADFGVTQRVLQPGGYSSALAARLPHQVTSPCTHKLLVFRSARACIFILPAYVPCVTGFIEKVRDIEGIPALKRWFPNVHLLSFQPHPSLLSTTSPLLSLLMLFTLLALATVVAAAPLESRQAPASYYIHPNGRRSHPAPTHQIQQH